MFDIGKRIKEIRERQSLSQQRLADICNLDRITVSRLENNHLAPSLKTLELVCTSLKTTLESFFADDSNDLPPDIRKLVKVARHMNETQRAKLTDFLETIR